MNDIEKIEGYPKVSINTSEYLFGKAIRFDAKRHPSVMVGGLWLNLGFGWDPNMKEDWCVDISRVKIILKTQSEEVN